MFTITSYSDVILFSSFCSSLLVDTEIGPSHCTPIPQARSTSPRCMTATPSTPSSTTEHAAPQQRSNKRRRISRGEEMDDIICEGLRESRMRWEKKAVNPDMSFGRHVGDRLSKMTPHQKATAQVRIQQVLLEVEFPSESIYPQPPP